MTEVKVLITCPHVWDAENEVTARLASNGIGVDMPRFEGQQFDEGDLLQVIGDYDGILAGDDLLTRRVLQSASRLKVISKWGVGVDGIDQEAAAEYGIVVLNTPGMFGEELADYAMGYVHLLARHQHQVDRLVKSGDWPRLRGTSLKGMVLGIVGFGDSGRALARRAQAASMRVIAHEVREVASSEECEMVSFDELLARSDVISLHLPANLENRHLIDAKALTAMKAGAWLVNTSRGSLVDEKALLNALRSGHLGGAALDVFEQEPVDPANPLLRLENVIAGAHNGSNTQEAVTRTTRAAVSNLLVGLGMDGD